LSLDTVLDVPLAYLLRYQQHTRQQWRRVIDPKVSVDDPPVRSEHRRSRAEAAAAQLRNGVPDISVLPAVAHPDARSIRGNAAPPKDMIAPQRRKVRPGPDGECHPAEGTRIEVDSTEPILAEFEQFKLEDAAPVDKPKQHFDLVDE
jgi:hypothetical protein